MSINLFKIFWLVLLIVFSLQCNAQFIKGTKIPTDTSYTVQHQYQKYKKNYPFIIPVKDSVYEGIIAKRNLVYTTIENTPYGKRELHLDLFCPDKKGKYPALIMVHGGAWRAGNKDLQVPMAEMIAANGFVTIAIEYQLSYEAQYPAAIYNIKSAIRWLRANADKFNIAPDKIAISGCSTGGHLAALTGLTNGVKKFEGSMGNENFSSDVQAIIDMDGLINLMSPLNINLNFNPNPSKNPWLSDSFIDNPELWMEASPIYWANENSVPMLFLKSGYPRFSAGQSELSNMFNAWGVYNEVHCFNIKMHTFWLFHPWVDETVTYVTDFLKKTFEE